MISSTPPPVCLRTARGSVRAGRCDAIQREKRCHSVLLDGHCVQIGSRCKKPNGSSKQYRVGHCSRRTRTCLFRYIRVRAGRLVSPPRSFSRTQAADETIIFTRRYVIPCPRRPQTVGEIVLFERRPRPSPPPSTPETTLLGVSLFFFFVDMYLNLHIFFFYTTTRTTLLEMCR